ncbi:MAG: aconitate hydratase AcnA [Bacteroidota bacterium]
MVKSEATATIPATLESGGTRFRIVDLPAVFGRQLARLPWSLRILAENVLRRGAPNEAAAIVGLMRDWLIEGNSEAEIAFRPGRLMMHDTTCIPALVDIAAMRDALAKDGGDPAALSPVLPVDVSVDHSIAVDRYAVPDALRMNMARELERNAERYRMMKWAAAALEGVKVHPPGTGIMHTLNLEQLATVIAAREESGVRWAIPDTLLGTDSHTPMAGGLGVLAWGIGGLEAEAVMFGIPTTLRIPEVVGVHLTGRLREGALSTDLALAVTDRLRKHGVSGRFVEFFGPGVATLSAGDRAVVANMAPEYGATTGYFPIDIQVMRYLRQTGRSGAAVALVEDACRRMGLWFDLAAAPRYTETISLDLATVGPSVAGPRRPQDRLSPSETAAATAKAFGRALAAPAHDEVPDGAVAIAAITSCTNTTDPRLLLAAGLLAGKARRAGLKPPHWVKTSLAPGSPAAARFLARAGVLEDLAALGFDIVGFGCTTCIGNSGPLHPEIESALRGGTAAVAILSGNRNFPGRVHPKLEAGYLASPPLVVAYALAGDVNRDILVQPLGCDAQGKAVHLAELWPTSMELDAALARAGHTADFAEAFAAAGENPDWRDLSAPTGPLFPWDEESTYLRPPPFAVSAAGTRLGSCLAHPLLVLGDDVTTDHISPAGQISPDSEGGRFLIARGEKPDDLNVFAARRGNWEVMLRGLFTNSTVRNLLAPAIPPGSTIHVPSMEVVPLYIAAERHSQAGEAVVVVAGARYGTGSSRDWAAKGMALLGVRAVLAESFERIHRANLIGMGILPLRLVSEPASALRLAPGDRIEIQILPESLSPRMPVQATLVRRDGSGTALHTEAAVETDLEVEQLRKGGVMPLILERALSGAEHTSCI